MFETLLQPGDEEERCGLILKDGTVVELKNVAAEPKTSFEMDAEEALPHIASGEAAMTWHTHPFSDSNLSGEDYSTFLCWPDLVHVIVGMRDGAVAVAKFKAQDGVILVCD
jgi:proteasome lid subunit RPN8/RPN11